MRIVHCISTFNTGGAEAMLVDIANEQVKTDDVIVIILDASYQQYLIDQFDRKIKVIKMNRKPMGKSPFPILMFNILLLRLRPDVIHVHTNVLMKFIVIPFSKRRHFKQEGLRCSYYRKWNSDGKDPEEKH